MKLKHTLESIFIVYLIGCRFSIFVRSIIEFNFILKNKYSIIFFSLLSIYYLLMIFEQIVIILLMNIGEDQSRKYINSNSTRPKIKNKKAAYLHCCFLTFWICDKLLLTLKLALVPLLRWNTLSMACSVILNLISLLEHLCAMHRLFHQLIQRYFSLFTPFISLSFSFFFLFFSFYFFHPRHL